MLEYLPLSKDRLALLFWVQNRLANKRLLLVKAEGAQQHLFFWSHQEPRQFRKPVWPSPEWPCSFLMTNSDTGLFQESLHCKDTSVRRKKMTSQNVQHFRIQKKNTGYILKPFGQPIYHFIQHLHLLWPARHILISYTYFELLAYNSTKKT